MRNATLFALAAAGVLAAAPARGADPKPAKAADFVFPSGPVVEPAPAPKADATAPLVGKQLYVITRESDFVLLARPAGLVKVTREVGPLRVYGEFWDAVPGRAETSRRYDAPFIAIVEAVGQGTVTLDAVPFKFETADAIKTVELAVDAKKGAQPPPNVDPKTDPKTDPKVDPQPVAPIPGPGVKVLIVFDDTPAGRARVPEAQNAIIYGAEIRALLTKTCGKDGFRIWPSPADATGEAQVWRDAYARPRAALPWVVISNGVTGYEGPLSKTPAEFAALLAKYPEK